MLLTKLFYFFCGYLVIRVEGQYPERFLNVCAKRGILLWNVFPRSKTLITCHISNRHFKCLPEIVVKTGVSVKIAEKHGLPVILAALKKRKGFVAGLLAFFFLLISVNQFIWKIEIVGCETVSKTQVEQKLAEYGLKIGAFRPLLDEKKLQNRVLIDMPELAWLWANKKGSKVIVEVKEKVPMPQMFDIHDFCNIVAKKDGVIDAMVVKSGVPMVALGDTVQKGDILVSGLILSEKGVAPRQVQSEAEIIARVWYEESKTFPLWETRAVATGEKESRYMLHLFGWNLDLSFGKKPAYSQFVQEEKNYELSFFGKYLGLGLTKTTYFEQESLKERMSVESIVAHGTQEIEQEIDQKTAPNSQKKESKAEYRLVDEDHVEVTVVAEYLEDIAEKVRVQ